MLSKRLKELREEKGYTQQEIASKIGLTKGHKGHKHSEETKSRISNSLKAKYGIKVICITTGEIFSSIKTAAQNTNATESGICLCCKGKQNYSGKSPVTNKKLSWHEYYTKFYQLSILF